MTAETLTGGYSGGFYLKPNYDGLTITNTASVGGTGVYALAAANVVNYGIVDESSGSQFAGLYLNGGGSVTNFDLAASITGYAAIKGGQGTSVGVNNTGTIYGFDQGILISTGSITNQPRAKIFGEKIAIYVGGYGNVFNSGSIQSDGTGVQVSTGFLQNGYGAGSNGTIDAVFGVKATGGATVRNYGTIWRNDPGVAADGGVDMEAGGVLTNGSLGDTSALIEAKLAVVASAASVTNFGVINAAAQSGGAVGVSMSNGAALANGSLADRAALIEGYSGVSSVGATCSVENFGTILGVGGASQSGVYVSGGAFTNGAGADTTAIVEAYSAVKVAAAGSVINFGRIDATGANATYGVLFTDGGRLTNGASASRVALIDGYSGVVVQTAAGTVANYATIQALGISGQHGVLLSHGGIVTNGGGADRSALIEGDLGVGLAGAAGSVRNSGTIMATGSSGAYGVDIAAGGTLANGSVDNGTALIEGYGGVRHDGAGTASNFGTIWAQGDTRGAGVALGGGGSLINGGAGHAGATVDGFEGVSVASGAASTVVNFGKIVGEGGIALAFAGPADVLQVEAASAFVGAVSGGGGLIDLASGTGSVSLFAGDSLAVSGSMALTTFSNFGTIEVGAGASFAMAGNAAVFGGQGLIDAGALTVAGSLSIAGKLTTTGTLAGTGTLALTGGAATFNTGTSLTIAKVSETGAAATAAFNAPILSYAGPWTQSAGTVSVGTGDRINFTGQGDLFSGTLAGSGIIALAGGADALTGTSITTKTAVINGASVTLAGTIALSGAIGVTENGLMIAAAGATLAGGGSLALSNVATNEIKGASASSTLTNSDRIFGAGNLGGGSMKLVNTASGIINGDDSNGLTIDTGAAGITNAGVIEATAAGGVVIKSAIASTGLLAVSAGTLTVDGAVSGTGAVRIGGGAADFGSSFSQSVAFTGTTGTLELAKSQTFAAQISGFSKTGGTSFDLLDIAFNAATTTAKFSGSTTFGVLTVTDGTHTAKITLEGNYTASTFTASSDSHGGTRVVDPARTPGPRVRPPTPLHPFITAAAGFGAGAGVAEMAGAHAWSEVRQMLLAPSAQLA